MLPETDKIRPVYDFLGGSAEFALTDDSPVRAFVSGKALDGSAKSILRMQPQPAVVISGELSGVSAADVMKTAIMNPDLLSSLEFNGKQIEGFSGGIWGSLDAKSNAFAWHPSTLPIIGRGDHWTEMCRVDFHLFNFRPIQTPGNGFVEQRGNAGRAIHRIGMQSSTLRVVIQSLYETPDQLKSLRAEGGSRLTHVGRIEQLNGSSFTGKDAGRYLHELGNFLSFAVGTTCLPVCACGFDVNEERVWEAWSEPSPTFGQCESWFHHGRCDQLQAAFQCYAKTIERDIWLKTIHAAIYWYLKANDGSRGIDAGVILAQAAFERLAYTFLVLDRALLSDSQFNNNSAAVNFELLFDQLAIPTSIPPACEHLTRISAISDFSDKWANLPKAIANIRNFLVHPKARNEHFYFDAMLDAWRASMWCLELAILAAIGYQGKYLSRISRNVVTVPWF